MENNGGKKVQVFKMLKKKINDPQILQRIDDIERNGLYNLISNQKIDDIIQFFKSVGDMNSQQIADLLTKLKVDINISGDKIYADIIRDIDAFATVVINCLFFLAYILLVVLIVSLILVGNIEFIKGVYIFMIMTVTTLILYIIFRIKTRNMITNFVDDVKAKIRQYENQLFTGLLNAPKSLLNFIENYKQ